MGGPGQDMPLRHCIYTASTPSRLLPPIAAAAAAAAAYRSGAPSCFPPLSLQEYFVKYYDSCMPLMTNILTHASGG